MLRQVFKINSGAIDFLIAFLFYLSIGLLITQDTTRAARILAYLPLNEKSHHFVYQPLILELGRRGHHVVYVSGVPLPRSDEDQPHPNVTHMQLENFGFEDEDVSIFFKALPHSETILLGEAGLYLTGKVCESEVIQRLINSDEQFDLILHEGAFIQDHAPILQHRFHALGVLLVSLGDSAWVNELSGLTNNPSYMIDYKVHSTDRMSFFERLYATYATVSTVALSYYYQFRTQILVDECFKYKGWESRPPLSKLLSDQALVLVNSHISVGYPFPKAPHYKEIGGINVVPNKPLPKDLNDFLDDAKCGAIYLSFGTNVDMSVMKNEFRREFELAFRELEYKVIWKWNGKPWTDVPGNVKLVKWAPQQDILAHRNVKLFITHGGLLSLFEAVNHAIPVVVVPFFGDQPKNARLVSSLGFGLQLDYENITSRTLIWAIRGVLDDEKYKKSAEVRSALFKGRPKPPLSEAIHWIEYVLKNGRVLQPASAKLSFIKMHLLDVYALITICGVIICILCKKSVLILCNTMFRLSASNKKNV